MTGQETTAGADGRLSEAVVEAAEGATCPCGHEALDHAWHGCEECACARSGIHACLASGFADEIRAAALREAADSFAQHRDWAYPYLVECQKWLRARADHTALGGRDRGEA